MTSRVFTSELRRKKENDLKSSSPNCKKVIHGFVCQIFSSLFNCFLIIVKFFSDFIYNTLSKNVTSYYVCVCVCVCEREREREITVKLLWNFFGEDEKPSIICHSSFRQKCVTQKLNLNIVDSLADLINKCHAGIPNYWKRKFDRCHYVEWTFFPMDPFFKKICLAQSQFKIQRKNIWTARWIN
jgi:hypothetical protein